MSSWATRTLLPLVAIALLATACSGEGASTDIDSSQTGAPTLTPANVGGPPVLCGGTVAAQLKDHLPGRLRLRDLETGDTTDVRLPPPPGGGKGPGTGWLGSEARTRLSTVVHCAETDEGELFVAYYYDEDYFYVARDNPKKAPLPTTVFGVTTDGQVAWQSDLPYVDAPVVRGGMVSVQHSEPDAVWPSDEPFVAHSGSFSVVDADDGTPVADRARRLSYAVGLAEDRLGYVRNLRNTIDFPVLVDGDLEPIWKGEPTIEDLDWYASADVAVVVSEAALIGVDLHDGTRLWRLARADDESTGVVVDRGAEVLVLNGDVRGRHLPAVTGRRKEGVISAIDTRTGRVLWRRGDGADLERDTVGIAVDSGVLALKNWGGDVRLYDARSGDPLRLPDNVTARSLGPTHVLVERNDDFDVIDRSTLLAPE